MSTEIRPEATGPSPIIAVNRARPRWANFHQTVRNDFIDVAHHAGAGDDWRTDPAPTWTLTEFAAVIAAQQDFLSACEHETVPAGATWSHARLLKTSRAVIEMAECAGVLKLAAGDLADGKHPAGLCVVAGGTRIKPLVKWLEHEGFTLHTSGSHGGQTLAGAVATGTHGARLGCRGIEQHVRGLLLVTGPDRAAWVTPANGRTLTPELLGSLAAKIEVHADDRLFGAALSHLGGLGLVTAILFQPTPVSTFEVVKQLVPLWRGWAGEWAAGDFARIAARVVGQAQQSAPGWMPPGPLTHCELNLNPWGLQEGQGNGCLNLRFAVENGTIIEPADGGPDSSALDILYAAVASELDEAVVNPLLKMPSLDLPFWYELLFKTEVVPKQAKRRVGTPNDLLPADHEQPKKWLQIWSSALAIATADVPRAVQALGEVAAEAEDHSFVVCLRPVKQSLGALGFCSFPDSTVIDLDGLGDRFAPADLEGAARAIRAAFDRQGIEYRMHWGKLAEPDHAKLVMDYGMHRGGLDAWLAARARLLDTAMARVFTSPRLRELKLA